MGGIKATAIIMNIVISSEVSMAKTAIGLLLAYLNIWDFYLSEWGDVSPFSLANGFSINGEMWVKVPV